MSHQPNIVEIRNPRTKSAICTLITKTLPEWFGIESANQMYAAQIVDKDVFAAVTGETPVGAIALRYHFGRTAEIWWMGVCAQNHRQGIGRQLMARAFERARERHCRYAVLNTVSPTSSDEGYAKTRSFYASQGFEPFLQCGEEDLNNPMIWMVRQF